MTVFEQGEIHMSRDLWRRGCHVEQRKACRKSRMQLASKTEADVRRRKEVADSLTGTATSCDLAIVDKPGCD